MNLLELFPEEDYRFHFRFERGEPADFFRATQVNSKLIAERQHWLNIAPERCLALLPDGVRLLEETMEFAAYCNSRHKETPKSAERGIRNAESLRTPHSTLPTEHSLLMSTATLKSLGCLWEPDFLLLRVEPAGTVRLVAGCVCFPSSWSLEEKIGKSI